MLLMVDIPAESHKERIQEILPNFGYLIFG